MEQDLIRERYDLSMARIRDFLTEETVPEVYRDYFKKVTELIIQCGEVLKAKKDGSLDKMTLEEGRALNQKLYAEFYYPYPSEVSYARRIEIVEDGIRIDDTELEQLEKSLLQIHPTA